MLLEALGKRRDFRFAEIPAGLKGVLFDLVDGELEEAAVLSRGLFF
jgi:hypothetical protein